MASNASNNSIESNNDGERELKITVIGNGYVGKTCLLKTYVNNEFIRNSGPTIFENYSKNINVDGQMYKTCLWDTAGPEEYKNTRRLCYSGTDCFIICYSVNCRYSFDYVESLCYSEIKNYCSSNNTEIPIILVGTKSDLRQSNKKCVSMKEGDELSSKIKAVKYIECSALNDENVSTVFEDAVRATNKKNDNIMASNVFSVSINFYNDDAAREFKITVIGSEAVGKTCLFHTYVNNQCNKNTPPIVFENNSKNINVDGQYKLRISDTAGQDEFKILKPQDYTGTSCFIICYSIDDQRTINDVELNYQEIKEYYKKNTYVPIILVGTKSDLRQSDAKCISKKEGDELRRKIKAIKYIECSTLNNENISHIFEEAVRAIIEKKSFCILF